MTRDKSSGFAHFSKITWNKRAGYVPECEMIRNILPGFMHEAAMNRNKYASIMLMNLCIGIPVQDICAKDQR